MTTNNYKLTEVTKIINQVVQCNCNKHNPEDLECSCDSCMQEQLDRLNEQLVAKAIADTEQRIIKLLNSVQGPYYEEGGAWSLRDGLNLAESLIKGEK